MTSTRLAPVLMVQGTSSHAGKSTLVAALCRLFARSGYSVAPFKAQNMSNNAAVTVDGLEVGRAQAVQALAARTAVTVDMNPVLLKPQSDRTSQVVVLGRARDRRDARQYYDRSAELWPVVTGALDRLRAAHELVIAEGAGSPAEINLAQYDLVNMRVARYVEAPVLLVGDIDRGGVFASLFGTVALLPEAERTLVRGFVINKFRGDPSLLDPGFVMLEERTGIPTLGVIPFIDLAELPAEDALEWEPPAGCASADAVVDIVVVRLPRIANLDEFQPLAAEPGVRVRWVGTPDELGEPDLIIVPGTKSTMDDLAWLRERGLVDAVRERRKRGTPIFGICGGFQMLGRRVIDEAGVESRGSAPGLDLLPVETAFVTSKVTRRVTGRVASDSYLWSTSEDAELFSGYEIHMGRTTPIGSTRPSFVLERDCELVDDGCVSDDGCVVGTYVHGLLEHLPLRRAMLRRLAERDGRRFPNGPAPLTPDEAIDRLADSVWTNIDMGAVARLVDRPLVKSAR
ncbi:MAG TPA: cobyric acid synthase [Gemmatimonadaceae bacterium]|nr:cobyric acid synthase [Gemmatimonadaceae bacterium]